MKRRLELQMETDIDERVSSRKCSQFRCKSGQENPILWDGLDGENEAECAEISFVSTYIRFKRLQIFGTMKIISSLSG
jgi:hypothetical protein